jgi:multidrug efflux system membrane fusion protein
MSMPRVRLGKRLLAGIALLIAIAVVVVFVTAGNSPSTSNTGGASAAAATVQRRNLVEQDTESGTLSYSDVQTVYNRLNGTVTWLPAVGQMITPGQALYKVNGEPVLLMDGSTPAYRGLSSDDAAAADILELNRNLVRLGFDADGITVDDTWQPGTTDGVEQLQTSLGEDATGTLPLGQIVFLPGDQLISTVDDAVGDTGSGGG